MQLCSGWDICHRCSVEAPECDERSNIVLRMSQLQLSIHANAQHNVIASYNLHAHHRGSDGERRDSIHTFGGGVSVPSEVDAQQDVMGQSCVLS